VLSKSTKIILNYAAGIGLFGWLSISIYRQLNNKENLEISLAQLRESIQGHLPAISVVVGLMLINWGIEALKWQQLMQPVERLSFRRSFSAILSGVSFSINTPNRIGEYGGRILYLRNRNRIRGISVTAVGSFSQFITTLFFGIVGLIYYIFRFVPLSPEGIPAHIWGKAVLSGAFLLLVIVLVAYFRLNLIVSLFRRITWLRKFTKFVEVINGFSDGFLLTVLALSVARYLVFSAQYLILLEVMGVQVIWWQGFMMIFLIYLVMALVPTIAIAELGIRGEIGLYFLGLLSSSKVGIIAATVGIWLINLVVPAIVGSLLLLGIKVLNEEKVAGILKKQRA
jgi:uncharacterized membrane protein YbhN (UPF0104 family)